MLKGRRDNALAQRDYWVLLPVLVIVALWVQEYWSCTDLAARIVGGVAILLGSAVLSTAIFYTGWSWLVISGFFSLLLLNLFVECVASTHKVTVGQVGVMLALGFLSGVLILRHFRKLACHSTAGNERDPRQKDSP